MKYTDDCVLNNREARRGVSSFLNSIEMKTAERFSVTGCLTLSIGSMLFI